MPRLLIVNGSVREGRIGAHIGSWVRESAEKAGRFTVDYADLADVRLPFMDEPNHPRLQQYVREHTMAWSARVAAADGYVFLFPEYNHSYSAPIKNAVDYLHAEWDRKPAGLVNWGGTSGGTRAQSAFRPVLSALGMITTRKNVEINFPQDQMVGAGTFEPTEQQQAVLDLQLQEIDELHTLRNRLGT